MARVEMFQHARVALQPNDGVSDIQPQRDWNGNSHVQQGILGFLGTAVTLSSQAFVATDALHVVAASSGTSDTLASITATNNLTNDWIQLLPKSGHTITVSHGTGNIFLQGGVNKVLNASVALILRYDGSNWYEWGNYQAAITSASNTFTKGQTITPVTLTALTVNLPTGPTGSSSSFNGGISIVAGTVAFATTAQTGDYNTARIDQATLTNPSSGTITNATSLKIIGAPIASTNVTITNAYSLWIAAGTTILQATTVQGALTASSGITSTASSNSFGASTFSGNLTMSSANIALGSNVLNTAHQSIQDAPNGPFGLNALQIQSNQFTNYATVMVILPEGTNNSSILGLLRQSNISSSYEGLQLGTDIVTTNETAIRTMNNSGTTRPLNVYVNSTKLLSFDAANTITAYVPMTITSGNTTPLTINGTTLSQLGLASTSGTGGNQILAELYVNGLNASSVAKQFTNIYFASLVVTAGSETGQIVNQVSVGGTVTNAFLISGGASVSASTITLAFPTALTYLISTYKNIATAGKGIAAIYGTPTLGTSLNTSNTQIATYTPASTGQFRCEIAISCKTTETVTIYISYVDPQAGTITTQQIFTSAMTGGTTASLTFNIWATTGDAITVYGKGGTALGDAYASCTIEQLQ